MRVQIQRRKHVADHANFAAPTRGNMIYLDHHTDEESICLDGSRSLSGNRLSVPCVNTFGSVGDMLKRLLVKHSRDCCCGAHAAAE